MSSGQLSNYATTFLRKRSTSSRFPRDDIKTPSSCSVENVGDISVKSKNNEDHSRSRWSKMSMSKLDGTGPKSGTARRTRPKSWNKTTRTGTRASFHMQSVQNDLPKITEINSLLGYASLRDQLPKRRFEEWLKPNRAPAARSARQRWSCSPYTCGSPDPTRPHVLWLRSERLFYIAESAVRKRFRCGAIFQKR